ncbi:hypothetical protein VaNZ11_002934 [Volvox africanus]|uniref:Pherophorin domain-containing protein n=1 Tax=Volvox africanus TaxID=51714 RepID=A0ABQ5RUB7_9CHLO|nr:hypothetical protein VaNZ11_002934 [Volvox africanus]
MAPRKHEAVRKTFSALELISGNSIEDDSPARSGRVEFEASGIRTPGPAGAAMASSPDATESALVTASSLPLSGVTAPSAAPSGLENLVKGLSSPSFYTSLASPHKVGVNVHGAAAGTSAVKTAAATAAFALSMTFSATEGVLGSACSCHDAQIVHTDSDLMAYGCNAGRAACSLTDLAAAAEAAWARCPCWQPSGYAMCGLADHAMTAKPAMSLSTKRGLYEGAVRGGNVRNTWLYITTSRNPPG